jgi:hypothetical protein
MKPLYILILISFLFVACTGSRLSYIGSKNAPTQKVDIYVDPGAITRSYKIIGKGYIEPNWRGKTNLPKMLAIAVNQAKQNGADAVFYRETFFPTPIPATNIQTYSRTDSIARGIITSSQTMVTPSYGFLYKEVLFLKYD